MTTIKNALWVGGPPGKTMDNIQRNLKKVGIKIVAKWKADSHFINIKAHIPKGVDVVLLNHEMCSHHAQEHVKNLCKREFKRFILAHTNASKTVEELVAKGIIEPTPVSDEIIFPAPVVVQSVTEIETTPSLDGVNVKSSVIFEGKKGIVYAKQKSNGKMRRVRPVVVGTALFMSAVEAAKFLEMDNKKLSALLLKKTATEINGFLCCYPDMTMATQMLGSVIKPSEPMTQLSTFSESVKLTDEVVDATRKSMPRDPGLDEWRATTNQLRKRYEVERESLQKRIEEIDHILAHILPPG